MNVSLQVHPFQVPFLGHTLHGDLFGNSPRAADVLFLHGAGDGHRGRFFALREYLTTRNVSSLAFDAVGHGESSGTLNESSLEKRVSQALVVYESLKISPPCMILGSSMGGAVAAYLTRHLHIGALVFFAPAAYCVTAFSVTFGPDFSRIIREPQSYLRSDTWDILKSFSGQSLLVTGGEDTVIPRDVIDCYRHSLTHRSSFRHIVLRNSPHRISEFLAEHPEELVRVGDEIYSLASLEKQGHCDRRSS